MTKSPFKRRIRLIYLRIIRLRESPHELALGMALGIGIGMMPIVPFHMIVAFAVAFLFRASKITAMVGTWICNPVTMYSIYRYGYKIGVVILGFDQHKGFLMPVTEAISQGNYLKATQIILSDGSIAITSFLCGGFVLGVLFSVPSYILFFYFFKYFIAWRESRKAIKA
jgi:uncharacterized protein